MLGVRLYEYGGVENFRFEELPKPEPQADEVLVRIHATSINPIDWRQRSGSVQNRIPLTLPIILGCDFAGTIEEVGNGVADFAIGDEVFGYCGVMRDGSYAQYIALPAAHIARKPGSMSMTEAGATPLGAITAWVAIIEEGGLSAGQSILIHGGAGGVGSMAVQIAKHVGATVYATGSARNEALIRSLGADTFIDYAAEKFENVASGMDVVLDTIGGETQARSWQCLAPGGFMAAIAAPPSPDMMKEYGARGSRPAARPDGAILTQIASIADAGALRVIIDSVHPLNDLAAATLLSEAGHARGKIAVTVP
jgi:NADPH:quinone reductase-like Zn-dependent oxidoreductase